MPAAFNTEAAAPSRRAARSGCPRARATPARAATLPATAAEALGEEGGGAVRLAVGQRDVAETAPHDGGIPLGTLLPQERQTLLEAGARSRPVVLGQHRPAV